MDDDEGEEFVFGSPDDWATRGERKAIASSIALLARSKMVSIVMISPWAVSGTTVAGVDNERDLGGQDDRIGSEVMG